MPVHRRLIAAYTLGAAYAGAAGALLAQTTAFVSLDMLEFQRSADVLLVLIIGGAGWLYGGIAGAIVYEALHPVMLLGSVGGEHSDNGVPLGRADACNPPDGGERVLLQRGVQLGLVGGLEQQRTRAVGVRAARQQGSLLGEARQARHGGQGGSRRAPRRTRRRTRTQQRKQSYG